MVETVKPIGVLTDLLQITDIPEIIDLLIASKKARFTIEGFSMYPTLRVGDIVEVDPLTKETLEVGDLVVFQKEKKLICHRLVEIFEKNGEAWIKTKGDTVEESDTPLALRQILGKVTRIERDGIPRIPSAVPQKLSFAEIIFFSAYRQFGGKLRPKLRTVFLRSLSSLLFRRVYRFLFRPDVIYSVRIPTASTPDPKFWRSVQSLPGANESLQDASVYRFFAKVGKNVVGSLEVRTLDKTASQWRVSHLFVRARYRGCHVATTLLRRSFQRLRRQGASLLSIEVGPQNRPALSLLKQLGFDDAVQKDPFVLQKDLSFPLKRLRGEKELQPFLYHALPSDTLKESFLRSVAKHLFFEQALLEIDTVFKNAGIPFIVQKGMALAYTLYPDPATRPMVDIDLYLRKNDVPSAISLLEGLGYELGAAKFREELITFGGELSFHKKNAPFVELHWCLEQYERLKGIVKVDEEDLWKRTVSYTISGRKFLTLCSEHQLLALSIHLGLIHRFRGSLKWFLDIDQFVMKFGEDLDWEELFQTARRWGIERVFCQVLLATQELFNTPLPPLPIQNSSFFLRHPIFQWFLPDRPSDRLRVLFRIFFPSREWLIYRYRLKRRDLIPFHRFLHPLFVLIGKTR
ncbi:MAG: signal peptidase I [Candidatus Omnitrophica bacterium]|nr:signal peptidase I [Candidatus Omnitrophota bacterium]